ncbi:FMN-binding protein [Desulfobacula phenolica]|uniref:4Fe-4S binding domain-containing protein n=1 Tax=Desulfobacula phenolica TaxID=90732 RepID=A0A1H2K4X8_9BACT|nr:FMN-binding protein [Desulfobacula phenolica]SDU63774.1 4Fe-4S binding domain-containing protein [Desulfobacula phenolica]
MKRFLPFLTLGLLLTAFVYGRIANQMDPCLVHEYYQKMNKEAVRYEPINDHTAKAIGEDGTLIAYLGLSSKIGYGGPLIVGTVISVDGTIKDILILDHKETASYITKITQAGFFRQFAKKQASDALTLNCDIDGVSGATLSTRAIASSVQNVAHTVILKEFNRPPQKSKIKLHIGLKEILVTLLFVLSLFLPGYKRFSKYRFAFLVLSMAILGFWLNRSLSMGNVGALFLGYFPSPCENFIWYIVLAGAIGTALFTGKNRYCSHVCPFCGVQEITHKISGINISLGKKAKWIRKIKDVILFAVFFLAFLSMNPSVSSFEPFGTIFGLNGSSYQWYLLFIILVASFFVRRFWCVAFCPVGTFLNKVASVSRKISGKIKQLPFLSARKGCENANNENV